MPHRVVRRTIRWCLSTTEKGADFSLALFSADWTINFASQENISWPRKPLPRGKCVFASPSERPIDETLGRLLLRQLIPARQLKRDISPTFSPTKRLRQRRKPQRNTRRNKRNFTIDARSTASVERLTRKTSEKNNLIAHANRTTEARSARGLLAPVHPATVPSLPEGG